MTVHNVSNQAQLDTAIAAALGGDTISLAAGSTYTKFKTNRNPGSEVLVISADSGNRAQIAGGSNVLDLNPGCTNWRFEDVDFKYNWTSGDSQSAAFGIIVGAKTVWFENCTFEGDTIQDGGGLDGAYNATALDFKTTQNDGITINNCRFFNWFRAIKSSSGNNINFTITGNDIHDLRSDGIVMSRVSDWLIRGNHFHRWQTSAFDNAHPDMMQIHRSGSPGQGSHRVTIEDNVLDHEDGNFGQLIFMGTSNQTNGAVGDPIRHTDIIVRGNLIYGSHTHGITVNWADTVTIANNSLIRVNGLTGGDGPGQLTINVSGDSTGVTMDGNIAEVVANQGIQGWTVTNNTEVLVANYSTAFTILASGTGPAGYNDYQINTGTTAHTNNSGSRMMKRDGGWGGAEIAVPSTYLGGNQSAGSDTTAPTVSSTSPPDNATGVSASIAPSVSFSENVVFGTGNITLRDVVGASDVEVFDVVTEQGSGAGQVEINGNVLTIHPTAALSASTEYAIRIDATAIDDAAGNSFAGIADDTTFSFTTAGAAPASLPTNGLVTISLTVTP